uniref:KRAB domain-containing protein n=1 Tax=Varanus komodoensis TaxID=61221 RepID=A0A8D2Q9H8_VARKO
MGAQLSLLHDGVGPDQALVTFKEVGVCFTEEEWALLDPGQRAQHSQIMEENRGILASLVGDWWKSEDSSHLSSTNTHRGETISLFRVWKELHLEDNSQ